MSHNVLHAETFFHNPMYYMDDLARRGVHLSAERGRQSHAGRAEDDDTITTDFKPKSNAHNMCAQESSLHTYRIIYNIYHRIISYKRLS
jgi:hypothetical protein